jgi:hypothetical protein
VWVRVPPGGAERVDFVLGTDNIAALRARAEALAPSAWKRLVRPAPYETKTGTTRARRHNRKQEVIAERGFVNLKLNYEDIAEFIYRPGKCQRAYRVVVVRKNISRTKGEEVLIDDVRYFFYFTTYTAHTHTPTQIVELANSTRSAAWPRAAANPVPAGELLHRVGTGPDPRRG